MSEKRGNIMRKNLIPAPMASDMRAVGRRASLVGAAICAALVGAGVKATRIATVEHEAYAEQGNRQQLRSFKLAASRGEIVDRDFMTLAVDDRVHKIAINPRLVRARGAEEALIEAVLEIEPDESADYLREEIAKDKAYRLLRLPLSDAQMAALQAKGIPGVSFEPSTARVYPRGLLASHVLGRVGAQGSGTAGVELGLDMQLRGREALSPAYFAAGKKLLVDGVPDPGVARGDTVVLTIDSAIQAMVEEEINTVVRQWNPVGTSILVLDPRNGEILALANRPTYDPNHPVERAQQTQNLAVQAAYEPGSTLKAVTVAAALELGAVRENETFYCEKGRWKYTPRHTIHDAHAAEWLTVSEILAASSNICTTKIADRLGKQTLSKWVKKFHFGERPGVQLPGATAGLLAPPEKWSDIQMANISFGQGMAASPLQVTAAFGALANDGVYHDPTIVQKILDARGGTVWEHVPEGERLVRSATAKTVMRMLEDVVHTELGTGNNAHVDGYRVAGKTSTAQKAGSKGYADGMYYSSFIGALPARAPRVVILVSVDAPEGAHYGNDVAAPSFARLGAQIMTHLGVPRDDGKTPPAPKPVVVAAKQMEAELGVLADIDVEPSLPGAEERGSGAAAHPKVTTGMPDFTGLTLAQAVDLAGRAKVELRASGSGVAVSQDVPPGQVESGRVVQVVFAPKK
ncbi:cell division protein FtsI (penicillin-binding protein 3) [Nannocystis exedens]|uniref:Cell division protein FtsI (Penicillin-binding protein 3) n=1 Tax=Nannocystis exedens TaxID=54 RepID=A0A1I1VXY6_9BACT|nr:penicillin-binding protein [Nannocystis exedens]PCC72800.1 penicillin-binding protein [Nannocystis exedens]SFD85893.1 cell division protein FtsI (penicillin-binding protein 3) [Nannocystis exedens]